MSAGNYAAIEDVTIPNGSNKSNVVRGNVSYADAAAISLQAPATLEANTYTIEVTNIIRAMTDPYVDADFCTLSDGTSPINAPSQGYGRSYTEIIPWSAFRVKSSGNVGANRTFKAAKNFTTSINDF